MIEKLHLELQMPVGPDRDPDCPEWFCVLDGDGYWCDFKLIQASGWGDNTLFPTTEGEFVGNSSIGYNRSRDTSDLSKAEPQLTGFIKWDGCIELRVANHMCDGARSVSELHAALQWMLTEVHKAMTGHAYGPGTLDWEPIP